MTHLPKPPEVPEQPDEESVGESVAVPNPGGMPAVRAGVPPPKFPMGIVSARLPHPAPTGVGGESGSIGAAAGPGIARPSAREPTGILSEGGRGIGAGAGMAAKLPEPVGIAGAAGIGIPSPQLPNSAEVIAEAGGKITEVAAAKLPNPTGGVAGAVRTAASASGEMSLLQLADLVAKPVAAGAEVDLPEFPEIAITNLVQQQRMGIASRAAGRAVASFEPIAQTVMSALGGALGVQARNLEIKVASGDALDTRQFSIQERFSSLFAVHLIALSDNPDISFDEVVGHSASFILHSGLHTRTWSGICSHLQQLRVEESGASTYELTIVPTLWFLTQRRNYRMFQQISEPDIVKKLLKEWLIEFDEKLSEVYKARCTTPRSARRIVPRSRRDVRRGVIPRRAAAAPRLKGGSARRDARTGARSVARDR